MSWGLILAIIIGGLVGFGISVFLQKMFVKLKIQSAQDRAEKIIEDAKKEAENIVKEAKLKAEAELQRLKTELENRMRKELDEAKAELRKKEEQLIQREARLDAKEEKLEEREERVKAIEEEIEKQKQEIEVIKSEYMKKLSETAGLSQEEARETLLRELDRELEIEYAKKIKAWEDRLTQEETEMAQKVITTAIQRIALDTASNITTTVVHLPNEEMKGRVIGREGRNIRTFEAITGVNVVIDDTPEVVVLSCWDPVRREIARVALQRLVDDGRIHPGRIEEEVEKAQKQIEAEMMKAAKDAVREVGIGLVPTNILKLLGRLKYRRSYGQNVLQHSIEVAIIAGNIAAELGLDEKLARRAGFFHDIGKAIDHEVEGSHAAIGADILKKNGESEIIVNAVAAHHDEVEPASLIAEIVKVADAISASREGARSESIEGYVKRIKQLEEIANSFEGVKQAFAMQAGRELRVIVEPEKIDDEMLAKLSYDIAKKIEETMDYPGQVKVVTIRELRSIEWAK